LAREDIHHGDENIGSGHIGSTSANTGNDYPMNGALAAVFAAELNAAKAATIAGNAEMAFHHLERAHILSQRHTWKHVHVHWLMLCLGASLGAGREVLGQLSRIVAAAAFSRIWVPIGNTGRANVSAVKPMPIPADLRSVLENGGL
jgi:uncharacterized protein DUF3703